MSAISAATTAVSLGDYIKRILVAKYALVSGMGDGSSRADTRDRDALAMNYRALETEIPSPDRWTSRARPTFLYVIYAMILWALPMGLVAAISPRISHAITTGMSDYLSALPDELYTLFGAGYLGYASLRQWGKAKGTDR